MAYDFPTTYQLNDIAKVPDHYEDYNYLVD